MTLAPYYMERTSVRECQKITRRKAYLRESSGDCQSNACGATSNDGSLTSHVLLLRPGRTDDGVKYGLLVREGL